MFLKLVKYKRIQIQQVLIYLIHLYNVVNNREKSDDATFKYCLHDIVTWGLKGCKFT